MSIYDYAFGLMLAIYILGNFVTLFRDSLRR